MINEEVKSEQYHRPFDKKGFVPLPDKQNKIKAQSSTPSETNTGLSSKSIYDPTCQDCTDDCYEDKLNQILLYKISGRCSLRVQTIQSLKVRQQEEYNIYKNSQNFEAYICHNGTYHLKENNHKVLMIRQAFRLITNIHGQFHLDGDLMRTILKTEYPWVCSYYLSDFILEFPLMCPYCRQFPAYEPALMPTPKSRMWFYLEPTRIDYEQQDDNQIITYSRPSPFFPYSVSPNIQPVQSMLQQLNQMKKYYTSKIVDPYHCQADTCEHDEYEAEYLICLFVFKENKYPLIKTNNQIGRLIHAIRSKIKQFQVRVCNQGTDHLWHKQKNQRILMKDEINSLLKIMHNGNITQAQSLIQQGKGYFHRNQKLMRFMLQKQTGIYPYNVIGCMKSFLNSCPFCCRKKYYFEPKRQEVVFQENQMVQYRMRQYDARKRYRATKQIPKTLSYDQILQKNPQGPKAQDFLSPTVVNGVIRDPNDVHPKDSQYSPQVKAMLQKYVDEDHRDMFEFFSNDMIWLTHFNNKKYPDIIADPNLWIRKYEYDGMYRMIIMTTESMRKSYMTYGQCLCADFVPMMIKRRSPSGRHFEVGFLTGMDQENRPVLFGVCFMSEDLMIYHRKMFEFFFEMVDQIIPGTIITSSGKNLSQAVYLMKKEDPLRYRFNHYLGWFYVIEDLKKDLSGEYDRSQMLKQFCNLLVQSNPITHEKRLIQITSQIVERTILQKFLKDKNRYCLSCLPPAFMGYALQTKRVEELYAILGQNFIYQSRMAQFMYYIFALQDKMNNRKSTINPEKNMQMISEAIAIQINRQNQKKPFPEVSQEAMTQFVWASEHLGQHILKNLIRNFVEAQRLTLVQQQDTINRGDSIDAFFLDSNNLKYSVRYCPEDQCWRCSCTWIYWTGVPCCHLIKMVLKQEGQLRHYINQRWIVDEAPEEIDEGQFQSQQEQQMEDESDDNEVKGQKIHKVHYKMEESEASQLYQQKNEDSQIYQQKKEEVIIEKMNKDMKDLNI